MDHNTNRPYTEADVQKLIYDSIPDPNRHNGQEIMLLNHFRSALGQTYSWYKHLETLNRQLHATLEQQITGKKKLQKFRRLSVEATLKHVPLDEHITGLVSDVEQNITRLTDETNTLRFENQKGFNLEFIPAQARLAQAFAERTVALAESEELVSKEDAKEEFLRKEELLKDLSNKMEEIREAAETKLRENLQDIEGKLLEVALLNAEKAFLIEMLFMSTNSTEEDTGASGEREILVQKIVPIEETNTVRIDQ